MSCNDYLPLLEEYIDGELNARNVAKVDLHLAACPACSAELDLLSKELDVYARYDREIEISPALWQSVVERIQPSAGSVPAVASRDGLLRSLRGWFLGGAGAPRFSPAMALALVLLAVGVTVLVMKYNGRQTPTSSEVAKNSRPTKEEPAAVPVQPVGPGGPDVTVSTVRPPGPTMPARIPTHVNAAQSLEHKAGPPTAEELVRRAEQGYMAAINILSKDVKRNKSTLDPAVLARFEAALSSIDRTIAETRQAVREHPGDALAVQYMQTAYSDKVELLKEMAGGQ